MSLSHHDRRSGWREWALASAVLLVGGVAALAQGTIVYQRMPLNIVPPELPWDAEGYRAIPALGPGDAGSVAVDINRDGQDDYLFTWGMDFGMSCLGDNKAAGYFITLWEGPWAKAVPANSPIGPSMSPVLWIGNQDSPFGFGLSSWRAIGDPDFKGIGEFAGVESAYVGLQLQINGNTHYGWIRLGAPLPFLNGGWIYDFAYETRPDTPILAGAIPEPSAWVLLSVGGIGILWFRRKRNEWRG